LPQIERFVVKKLNRVLALVSACRAKATRGTIPDAALTVKIPVFALLSADDCSSRFPVGSSFTF
jgi:hypothetical protein